jgi:tRNA(adenine34) deaminase
MAEQTSPPAELLPSRDDQPFLARAVELALRAEREGNLPIGAVIVLDGRVVGEGANRTLAPLAHPGRHAEMLALASLPEPLLARLPEMTCYTTLEPCVMCFGALVEHRVGRVVFGAADPHGGAAGLLAHLPAAVADAVATMSWMGPVWPQVCGPLLARAAARYWAALEAPPRRAG